MKPDARGWLWHEKAWLVISHALWRCANGYFNIAQAVLPKRWKPWAYNSRVYLWLCGESYLYDDWRRGDLPENVRAGGIWR